MARLHLIGRDGQAARGLTRENRRQESKETRRYVSGATKEAQKRDFHAEGQIEDSGLDLGVKATVTT